MPRTGMFGALRRLVAEHSGAERAGMPVAEFRDTRQEGTSRRAMLKLGGLAGGLAVTGATPAWASSFAPRNAMRATPRVAVIGAGIAGLNTALTLQDHGVACTVHEASDRVGGRMYSERSYWSHGQTSEWGGELIDSDHETVRALADRFGLDLVDVGRAVPQGSDEVLHFGGEYYPIEQADRDFAPVYRVLRQQLHDAGQVRWNQATPTGLALDTMSVYEWIDRYVPGGHGSRLGRYFDVAYAVEYGADTVDQTALNLLYLMAYQKNPRRFSVWGTSDERFHIVGGNQRLPEAMAAALPAGTIRHGRQLLAVRTRADGTQTLVFDEDGRTHTEHVDHTVLAVPLGVLQRLDLSRANLDSRKQAWLGTMRMGDCTKLNMQFDERCWLGTGPWPGRSNGEAFSDRTFQQVWDATAGQPGRPGILVQYGGGSGAERFQPSRPFLHAESEYVRRAARHVLSDVEHVLPGVRAAWTGRATLSAWHRNPLSHGAYAYWPVGYAHRFLGYEAVPQGHVHFAGEHTSMDYQGYMNGGAAEGARAAREILDVLTGARSAPRRAAAG